MPLHRRSTTPDLAPSADPARPSGAVRVGVAARPAEHSFPARSRDATPLLTLRGLSAGYDGFPALRNVDLLVRRGEFVGIVGPSGSGKTTLLRSLLGQTQRLAGDLQEHPPVGRTRLQIGYVPQVESIDWNFPITVEQVVLLGRWRESGWRPWTSRRDRTLARQVLERLGIADLAKRPIRALSGGQQQRVFIARALIGDPDIVLLDEPTSGVDIKTRHDVMHLLSDLNRGGVAIVLTTHDLNAVASHLPRLVCIGEGRVVADGTPPEVLTPDILCAAYGAEMVVLRRGRSVYVVEHDDAPGVWNDDHQLGVWDADKAGGVWDLDDRSVPEDADDALAAVPPPSHGAVPASLARTPESISATKSTTSRDRTP